MSWVAEDFSCVTDNVQSGNSKFFDKSPNSAAVQKDFVSLPCTSVKMKPAIYTRPLFNHCFHSRCIRLLLWRYAISWPNDSFIRKVLPPAERILEDVEERSLVLREGREGDPGVPAPPAALPPLGTARRGRGCRHRPGKAPRGLARGGGSPPAPVPMAAGGWLCLDVPARLQDGNSRPPRGGSSGSAL